MKPSSHILPPKWPLVFLRWFLKGEYLEEIEGDLEEVFLNHFTQFFVFHKYFWKLSRLEL